MAMTKKHIFLIIVIIASLIAGFKLLKPEVQTQSESGIKITGNIKNKKVIEDGIEVIETNLKAVNKKDMPTYLSTLVKSAQEDTKEEMSQFFKEFTVENELLEIKVLDETTDRLLLQAQQKTTAPSDKKQKEKYRNHISTANHTLVKEDGEWKIAETIMTDTQFIN